MIPMRLQIKQAREMILLACFCMEGSDFRILQHRIINPLFFDQFLLAAGFDELPLTHDVDGVCFPHCVQPVGDDEARSSFHQPVERFLDFKLGDGVDAACRFVEQQQYRVCDECSCDG